MAVHFFCLCEQQSRNAVVLPAKLQSEAVWIAVQVGTAASDSTGKSVKPECTQLAPLVLSLHKKKWAVIYGSPFFCLCEHYKKNAPKERITRPWSALTSPQKKELFSCKNILSNLGNRVYQIKNTLKTGTGYGAFGFAGHCKKIEFMSGLFCIIKSCHQNTNSRRV